MRGIRVTTAAVLIVALGVLLVTIGVYLDDVLVDHARRSTRQTMREEATRIIAAASRTGDDAFEMARRVAIPTGRRATVFSPEGEVLADIVPAAAGPAGRPSTSELWRVTVNNVDRPGLIHSGVVLDDGSTLLLTSTPLKADEARAAIRSFLWGTFLVLAVIATIAAMQGWRSIDQSLDRIEAVTRRLRKGELDARVREVRQGALLPLTASINRAFGQIVSRLSETREQGRYYAAILDQMTDAVVAVDERGQVRFINRHFSRLFEVEPEEAAGRPVENVLLNYEISALVTRALQQGAVQRSQLRLAHPEEHVLEAVSTPLTDESGRVIGAVGLLHDITQLREANRVRQDFVANASHELRTPAASVKALAETLQSGAMSDPEHGPKFLRQIVESADRLTEILDDMLTLSRVERGARMLEPETIDVRSALKDAADQVRPAAASKNVSVSVESAADDVVYADRSSLRTLLLNLLDNAVKYTAEGGEVSASGREVPGGYEIAVSDTGVGIPKDDQQRIFERFYRVDRARDRRTGSTGLGLSIVKHIAEAHGGRVTVSSQPGEGSTFTAFFPSGLPGRTSRSGGV